MLSRTLSAVAVALAFAAGLALARQPGDGSGDGETRIRVELIGYGGRIDKVLGVFSGPTAQKDADACEKQWADAHPDDLRLTRQVTVRVTRLPPGKTRPKEPDPVPSVPRPGGGRPGPTDLANSTWTGNETLQDYGQLTFDFRADWTVTMHDRDGKTDGTWQKVGRQVTLRFYDGSVVYTGTVNGELITGDASDGRRRWKWRVHPN